MACSIMSRSSALLFFAMLTAVAAPAAQVSRTGIGRVPVADPTLPAVARDLSDKAQDAWNVWQGQPARSVDLHMSIGAFAGSALGYAQAAAATADSRALENGARKLVTLAREIDALVVRETTWNLQNSWRPVQVQVTRLSDLYQLGYTAAAHTGTWGSGRGGATQSAGRFRWRGRVDGSDEIQLSGSQVMIRHVLNNPVKDASYELPAALPRQALTVQLNKIRGRGKVEITAQPSVFNNYTVTVLVEDPQRGDELYEFELSW